MSSDPLSDAQAWEFELGADTAGSSNQEHAELLPPRVPADAPPLVGGADLTVEQLIDLYATITAMRPGAGDEHLATAHRMSPARFWQRLTTAARTREALEHDPVTTNRILERLDRQAQARERRAAAIADLNHT